MLLNQVHVIDTKVRVSRILNIMVMNDSGVLHAMTHLLLSILKTSPDLGIPSNLSVSKISELIFSSNYILANQLVLLNNLIILASHLILSIFLQSLHQQLFNIITRRIQQASSARAPTRSNQRRMLVQQLSQPLQRPVQPVPVSCARFPVTRVVGFLVGIV